MAAEETHPVECSAQPLGLSFHPTRRIVGAGLVDGTLELHNFEGERKRNDVGDDEDDTIVASLPVHVSDAPSTEDGKGKGPKRQPSCRSVLFSHDGARLYAAGSGGGFCSVDTEVVCSSSSVISDATTTTKGELWKIDGASPHGINRLFKIPETSPAGRLIVTGDDEGVVRLWDERMCGSAKSGGATNSVAARGAGSIPAGCVMAWSDQEDYISGFDINREGTTLLATSADCTLGVYDVRKASASRGASKVPKPRLSDDQEDELLSVSVLKNGRKVVCGTGEGVLAVWSWGTWGDVSDRFPGHPNSIETLLKIDEDTVLTGSGDGIVRIVQVQPDKLLGVLGGHDGFPVEELQFSSEREYVGSISHDALIRMWDASILCDNSDDSDEEGKEVEKGSLDAGDGMGQATSRCGQAARGAVDSDDDWADEDDDDGDGDTEDGKDDRDSDESDDPDDDDRGGKKPRLFKTENEKFFEEL